MSNQIELENPDLKQQINFIGILDETNGATNDFHHWKIRRNNFWIFMVVWFILLWDICKVESEKIVYLLNDTDNESSKFAARKLYVIDDNREFGEGNENYSSIKLETNVIKSSLCDYSVAYILLSGHVTATDGDANTKVAFENWAPFTKWWTHWYCWNSWYYNTYVHFDWILWWLFRYIWKFMAI